MSRVAVRRCLEEDWPEVRRLQIKMALGLPVVVDVDPAEVLATPEDHWRNFVRDGALDPRQALFVAEGAPALVGTGHVRLDGDRGRLAFLYVDEEARRRGTATALVEAQGRWAASAGATELVCHIPADTTGERLAESLGWHRSGEVFYTRHGLRERLWTAGRAPTLGGRARSRG